MAVKSAIFSTLRGDILMKKLLFISLFVSLPALAEQVLTPDACLIQALSTADDSLTVGDLRQLCSFATVDQQAQPFEPKSHVSALKQRQLYEKQVSWNSFSLLPHKPNYIMLSYNTNEPNQQVFEQAFPTNNSDLQHLETKFQISMKLPIAQGIFNGQGDLYAAYTNRSFWQQFNKTNSSPFRDTNHEAESWLAFATNYDFVGLRNSAIHTGFSHQSNGQSGSLSRSWNRLYTEFLFEKEDVYLSFKPWFRIPESSHSDDNPDIDHYMGHFELRGIYKKQAHTFDFMLRNNLKTGSNRGALELGWSFPIHRKVRGYVQWFNGYGESLLDYDNHTNSLGFGIQLSDWL